MADVWGSATVEWDDGHLFAVGRLAPVPKNALSAVSEGFCPNDLVQLAGDTGRWCPSCRVIWHLRHEPEKEAVHDG